MLTDSSNPQTYWRVLKKRLLAEGHETVTNCNGLKMQAADGKMRMTDVADTEQLFRLIQSIPSPKAEPFKLWMSRVASERIDQMQDPELSIDQAIMDYKRLGYSDNWINQRIKSIEVRKELTDEWKRSGMDKMQYASDSFPLQFADDLHNSFRFYTIHRIGIRYPPALESDGSTRDK